ncbi:PLP-dependent aminotransferase family protein [Nakamurella flava]|uniref:PLP-dependent aminotransferase family protein n=1 Tax=Nakamurella flava TaxID=2576308 RepID=A0A4U6QK34_9ACTN|nr:PLP-dependent aminotransferase family protein [Nakamurella flava]TKV60850.1 PLP-dependent aminotransferase family protein [Nakamurella flava]
MTAVLGAVEPTGLARPTVSLETARRLTALTAGFPLQPVGPGSIPLSGGIPAPDVLPVAELAESFATVLTDPAAATVSLPYARPEGVAELRAWLADREGVADPDRIQVTDGALHAISLIMQAVLDPGDLVLVESPTFPLALRLLQYHGARWEPVPVDAHGLDVDELERRLRAGVRPRMLYLIPDFQNPTAVTLSAQRRTRLVELAERYGFVVLADNPYQELTFGGNPLPGLDVGSDRVVRANTFSKTLGPGLRTGWLVLPRWLREPVTVVRANTDQFTSLVTQRAIADLVTRPGRFEQIVQRARVAYARRAATLRAALLAETDGALAVPDVDGGIFLWARITRPGLDADQVLERALLEGTNFQPGRHFDAASSDGSGPAYRRHLRLGFSAVAEDDLVEAARRLGRAVRAQ